MARVIFRLFIAVLATSCVASNALAQPDPALDPTYGSVALKAGFPNDPHKVAVQAGGRTKTNLGGVAAYVEKNPDFRLNYVAGKYPLSFSVVGKPGVTLLVNLPDGTWMASNGGGSELSVITIAKPKSARYAIYVGTVGQALVKDMTLCITEREVPSREALPKTIQSGNAFEVTAADFPTEMLAEGPFDARVRFVKKALDNLEFEEDVRVVSLSKDHLFYSLKKGDKERRTVQLALPGKVVWVEGRGQKWQSVQGTFIGKRTTPPPVRFAALKFSALQEAQHNFYNLSRLQPVADGVAANRDEIGWGALKASVQATADHLKARGMRGAFAGFPERLIASTEQNKALRKKWSDACDEYVRGQVGLATRRSQMEAVWRARRDDNMVLAGGSALAAIWFGEASFAHEAIASVRSVALARENYLQGQFELQRDNETLNGALKNARTVLQKKLDDLLRARDEDANRLAQSLQVPKFVGSKEWGAYFATTRDRQALATLVKSEAEAHRRNAGRPNPWLEVDAAVLSFSWQSGDRQRTADKNFELAKACAQIVENVPPGTFYDADRFDILCSAACLAAGAAHLEWGDASWENAYHPYAAWSVRMFEKALTFKAIDADARFREMRILALALGGRGTEAYDEGLKLQAVRGDSPAYNYYMARLKAPKLNKNVGVRSDDVISHAEKTVASGVIRELRVSAEIVSVFERSRPFQNEFEKRVAARAKSLGLRTP